MDLSITNYVNYVYNYSLIIIIPTSEYYESN